MSSYQHTTPERRRAWRFFHENAGGIVGRSAEQALELARAEELLDTAEELGAARFTWEDDPEPYDPGTETTLEEARRLFESNTWTGPYGAVLTIGDDPGTTPHGRPWSLSSLWGIVLGPRGTGDPYARTVRAELALDLADDLAAAIARAEVVELAAELAARVGTVRAQLELRQVLDALEQEAGR